MSNDWFAVLLVILLAYGAFMTIVYMTECKFSHQGWSAAMHVGGYLDKMNPYAHLLGQVVEAKVYAGSDWERFVVVAVSWRGAVCVRPLRDLSLQGRWIGKDVAPQRVRMVKDEQ